MKRRGSKRWRLAPWLGLVLAHAAWAAPEPRAEPDSNRVSVILVVGAAGQPDYEQKFRNWAQCWRKAGQQARAVVREVGLENEAAGTDLERLKRFLGEEAGPSLAELWLVLIGHGTFDGHEAKFNLRGPDFSADDLAAWLASVRRPLVVINTASASAPFINRLSAPGRVIVTATRSGSEQNYCRFGGHLAEALTSDAADLDKDKQLSVLEAFLMASRAVAEWYELEGRLATEHALIDDNGDGLGTPADWFRGIRAVKKDKEGGSLDGLRAHQIHLVRSAAEQAWPADRRARRDEIELQIAKLRETKPQLSEKEYYQRLETLLLEMAQLYEGLEPPD